MEIKNISRKSVRFSEEDIEALEKVQDILQTILGELTKDCDNVLETQNNFYKQDDIWNVNDCLCELVESDEIWIGN